MIELGIAGGLLSPRVERRNYTGMLTTAAEVEASAGLLGAAVGAVEVAARMYAAAFASGHRWSRQGRGLRRSLRRSWATWPAGWWPRVRRCYVVEVDGGAVLLTGAGRVVDGDGRAAAAVAVLR